MVQVHTARAEDTQPPPVVEAGAAAQAHIARAEAEAHTPVAHTASAADKTAVQPHSLPSAG